MLAAMPRAHWLRTLWRRTSLTTTSLTTTSRATLTRAAFAVGLFAQAGGGALAQPSQAARPPQDIAAPTVALDATATRALARAEREIGRGRLARALALLEASVRRTPHDVRAALWLCDLLIPEDDATLELPDVTARAERCEASLALSRSAASEPWAQRHAWARALRGDRREALGRWQARLLDERDVAPLQRVATLAVAAGALEEAEIALQLARRVRPHELGLIEDLAAVRLARGDAASAVTLLRTVVAARPDDDEALRDLAGACLQAGELASAVRHFEQRVQIAPSASRWVDLARARLERGDATAAIADARRALALDPQLAEATLALGDALRLAGDLTEAREAYAQTLRLDPRSARAAHALTQLEPP